MTKLTKAQIRALSVLPVTITTWGGRPFAGMPEGIKSRATLHALNRLALVGVTHEGLKEKWTITPAGRAALSGEKP